ncbi:LOW QUALITY PROTEIN: LIM/homeobox protein Lhx9 [Passer montanus]|uniref:LOW QUALITY PROTEIN: LIM/homeobox protein Lhx9 n=1 Tax=Passer montanus TaxID=9160 RepID=UPI00195F372E|nr:LOW QUALITY PROTEIN: LIM/homeobox protein Lhx9 [Passer montanus]XP_041276668.1 LOW QUALITY PROTEIN: LIM/homeobox protein Lhx9 [Onychostruthus taczanowskii]
MEEVTRGAPEDVSGMLWKGSGGWGTSFTSRARVWCGVFPREQGAQDCRQEDPSVGIEVSGNSQQLFQGKARKSGVKRSPQCLRKEKLLLQPPSLRCAPRSMLFHGISGGHIQGIMEEMERRSKTESRLAKGGQMNGRDTNMPPMSPEKPALCAGCGGKISDRYYLLAVDKQWHLRCLKCCECKLALESELTCFAKDGSIYCKEDYYRRFSVQRCARCHLGISASEMVMRARESVYHLSCFTCTTCNKTLTTGDHFGMKDNLVYCRAHFESLLQGEYPPQLSYTELAAKSGGLALPYFNGTGTVQKGRPRKRKSPALGVDIVSYNSGCNENEADHLDRDQQPYPPSQKTKRMRTSFKHHQLRTMKSYFAINHNPDAKDLKQLAQKTGLTKRVLQVWFQNARAKFRRNLLRQENGGVDKADGTSLPAPPSADSGALTPPGTATTLTDLTNPTITVVTSVTSNLDSHESGSPSQTTLTNLF